MTINTSHKTTSISVFEFQLLPSLHFQDINMKKMHIFSLHIKKRNDEMLQIEQACIDDNSAYFEVVTV
jgi:hypothetical protein